MFSYSKAAVERAMKVQEVMLRAWAKKITWWQAAEIVGRRELHFGLRAPATATDKFASDLIYYVGADESRMRKDLADIPKSNRALPLASVYFKLRSTYA